jgi:hypothetical protein
MIGILACGQLHCSGQPVFCTARIKKEFLSLSRVKRHIAYTCCTMYLWVVEHINDRKRAQPYGFERSSYEKCSIYMMYISSSLLINTCPAIFLHEAFQKKKYISGVIFVPCSYCRTYLYMHACIGVPQRTSAHSIMYLPPYIF